MLEKLQLALVRLMYRMFPKCFAAIPISFCTRLEISMDFENGSAYFFKTKSFKNFLNPNIKIALDHVPALFLKIKLDLLQQLFLIGIRNSIVRTA